MNIYFCNVTSINSEFKIDVKNFMVTIEAEDGNIFEAEAIANPPAAPEAFTAASEAEDSENEEVQTSIFDAVVTNQPGQVALTRDD